MIVARFAEQLGEDSIPILQLASRYSELGERAATRLAPDLSPLGLELARLVVESIALPDEVAVDRKPQGPFDVATLRDHVAEKLLTPGTLVWREGMAQWAPAGTMAELAALFGRTP